MRLRQAIESLFRTAPATALEQKASRAGPLLAIQGTSQPVWSPRDYAALAREGFAKNPVVHRAVRLLSETAAAVPLLLFEGDEELTTHPLLSLLARPNTHETGADFLEALYGYLLVSGNAYLEQVAVDGLPRELYALRPDRMKVVPSPHGWPEAFDYTVGGRTVRLAADGDGGVAAVRHLKLFHPLNDHYGFAPVEAAQMALDIHNAAASWNKALLDNAARPSGALIYGVGDALNLTSDQFDRLASWLGPGFGGDLRLEPDLDAIEALSSEREALWRRVGDADFISKDEKRLAVGYGARDPDSAEVRDG